MALAGNRVMTLAVFLLMIGHVVTTEAEIGKTVASISGINATQNTGSEDEGTESEKSENSEQVNRDVNRARVLADIKKDDLEQKSMITPCLSGLMEELNASIAARLAVMGRDGDQVLADVSVATDTETAQLALQQGYEPLSQICTQVPEALAELDVSQRDAILLRLTDASNGETCNRLLLEGALKVSPVQLAEPALPQVPNAELESESFVYAPEAELPAEDWAPATDEYETIFDQLGDTDFDLDFDAYAGDGPIDMAEAVEEILAEEFVADDEQTLELKYKRNKRYPCR